MVSQEIRKGKIRQAHQAAEELSKDPSIVSIYLTGSLMDNLGSPTSDVDIFAIRDCGAQDNSLPTQLYVGKQRVDVEMRDHAWLATIESLARPFELTSSNQAQRATSYAILDEAYRLKIGQDLKSHPDVARTRKKLDESWDDIRKLMIALFSLECSGVLEDVLGALADEDDRSATLMSKNLLLTAAQAFLVACGESYVSSKWTWPKLLRIPNLSTFPLEDFSFLLDQAQSDRKTRMEMSRDRIEMAQVLLAAAQLFGWESPSEKVPANCPFTGHKQPGGVVRNENWSTIRRSDKIQLSRGDEKQAWDMRPEYVVAWMCCDGRPLDKVIYAALESARELDSPESKSFSAEDAETWVKDLVSNGVATII